MEGAKAELAELEELRELRADVERKEKQQAAIIENQVGRATARGWGLRGRGSHPCGRLRAWRAS